MPLPPQRFDDQSGRRGPEFRCRPVIDRPARTAIEVLRAWGAAYRKKRS